MTRECVECGEDAVVWPNGVPRCENHPPEECKRCEGDLDNESGEMGKWDILCEECWTKKQLGVWCDECVERLRITGVGYDGVKITCGCSGFGMVNIPSKLFRDAPYSWKYEGRHGEVRFRKL